MNELALFAGAGGGLLATTHLLRWRTVCYVEWDDYCIDVLKQRITDGYLHDAPIWDDVRTFDGRPWAGCVDIITAGFPCQPFSTAGNRDGANDKRNMWPDTIRIIREVRPAFVLLENVRGLLSAMDRRSEFVHSYFGTVLGDLAQSGYDARWRVLSAGELGAPHKRDRIWIMAHSTSAIAGRWTGQCQGQESIDRKQTLVLPYTSGRGRAAKAGGDNRETLADAKGNGQHGSKGENGEPERKAPQESWLDVIRSSQKMPFATPSATDHKTGLSSTQGRSLPREIGGQLNPDWEEWLMGWPIGWTALKPLETDKFQQWLRQFGGC